MRESSGQFHMRALCRAMDVSPGGYYDWLRREPSSRAKSNDHLLTEIQASHLRAKGRLTQRILYYLRLTGGWQRDFRAERRHNQFRYNLGAGGSRQIVSTISASPTLLSQLWRMLDAGVTMEYHRSPEVDMLEVNRLTKCYGDYAHTIYKR